MIKSMSKIYNIVILALLVGCAEFPDNGNVMRQGEALVPGSYPMQITFDENMPQETVEAAIDWWDEALKVYFNPELIPPKPVIDHNNPNLFITCGRIESDFKIRGLATMYQWDKVQIEWSEVFLDNDSPLCVLVHEFGHAVYGLDDDPKQPSIMAWGCDSDSVLTFHDANLIIIQYQAWLERNKD